MAYAPLQDDTKLPNNIGKVLSDYNDGQHESIRFWATLLKINTRNKPQERLFILTNRAIYYLKPKAKSIRQRIPLSSIAAITQSSKSEEFSLNIPSQYDYRFDAKDRALRTKLISAVSEEILNLNHDVLINTIHQDSTATWTITKNDLKSLNAHHDDTVRIVFALDHLNAMGFKTKPAHKSLRENGGNLSTTMMDLLEDYVKQLQNNDPKVVRNTFKSPSMAPVTKKMSVRSCVRSPSITSTSSIGSPHVLSPQPSFTEVAYEDVFAL